MRKSIFAYLFGVLFICTLGLNAQIITVNTTKDDDSKYSLRKAVEDADSGDTIHFDSGLSGKTVTLNNEYGMGIDIGKNLTIDGENNNITISIGGMSPDAVFSFYTPNQKTTPISVTLNHLNLVYYEKDTGFGAIVNNNSILTIENSTIKNFSTDYNGGGIQNVAGGALTIKNTSIQGNTATKGGGIYNDSDSKLFISDSEIDSNFDGSGIYNLGQATITNTKIHDNISIGDGGGIYNDSDYDLTVSGSKIFNNSGWAGGGIYNKKGKVMIQNYSSISNNTAKDQMKSYINEPPELHNGGGIYNADWVILDETSTITNNQATDHGGGVYLTKDAKWNSNGTVSDNTPEDIYPKKNI